MSRPLICLDVETTGTDPERDRVISLAVISEGGAVLFDRLFNPTVPIPAEATAVHNITDADVAEHPSFASQAHAILPLLTGVDILGFSPRLLDLPILDAEFSRTGIEWGFDGLVIDAAGIYHRMYPRTLAAACEEYTGQRLPDAHDALIDARATLAVFQAQRKRHELSADRVALAKIGARDGEEPADLSGKLRRDADGDIVYTFGKHKGKKVRDEREYAHWMLGKDFPGNTKRVLEKELERLDGPGLFNDTHAPETDQDIPF